MRRLTGKGGLALALAAGLAVTGCSAVYRNHGYAPSDDELSLILVGVDTDVTVEDSFGPPITSGILGDRTSYYVESRWRHFGATKPRPISRELVAISYDADGVVSNIERFGLQDGRVVPLSRRVTGGGARNISFIRQLLGNLGRISAEQLIGGGN